MNVVSRVYLTVWTFGQITVRLNAKRIMNLKLSESKYLFLLLTSLDRKCRFHENSLYKTTMYLVEVR